MQVLPVSFVLLQVTGLWMPSHCHSLIVRPLYKVFSVLVLFFIYWYVITGLIEFICNPSYITDTSNDFLILVSMISNCGRCINIVICRNLINEILHILRRDPCLPRDENEILIQKKWDRIIWTNTLFYGLLIETTGIVSTFGTFLLDIPIGILPFKAWLPYNYSHGIVYWQAYFHQIITLMLSTNICIGYDTLVRGFIIQVSAKLHILKHRINTLPETLQHLLDKSGNKSKMVKLEMETKLVAECVNFHLTIFKLAHIVNKTFGTVVCLQYCLSGVIICFNVYTMAHINVFSTEFIQISLFLCCMLYQIYTFCQVADDITLVSTSVSDAVYTMNWTALCTSTIKSLIFMMRRTIKPIEFRSNSFITLSRNSFMNMIKLSYSMYNLLQDTSS